MLLRLCRFCGQRRVVPPQTNKPQRKNNVSDQQNRRMQPQTVVGYWTTATSSAASAGNRRHDFAAIPRKHRNFHQSSGTTRTYIEVISTCFKKGYTLMRTRSLTKVAVAAAVALSAITSVSTVSFAAGTHYRHHHGHVTVRHGYAHGFRPDVNIPGSAGNRPDYNAPGVSPLDPCGDICDSAIMGGGA